MADFRVDPEQILQVVQQLEGWTDQYSSCVNRIEQVAQDLPQSWGGAAQASYINQLAQFHNDFEALYTLFNKYATYLRQSAAKYSEAEEAIVQAAKSLQTGN